MILLDPAEDSPLSSNAGHAIVRNGDGTYWDPATPDVTYESFEDWQNASTATSPTTTTPTTSTTTATPTTTTSSTATTASTTTGADSSSAPTNGSMYTLTELGTDESGEPVGIDGQTLYDVATTENPEARAAKLQSLSEELGVPATFFGGHQYASGGSITVPEDTPTVTFATDPQGVSRVDVNSLDEPLRSQLLAANTIEANTGAGAGRRHGDAGREHLRRGRLHRAAGGHPGPAAAVFQTGTVNTLSIFANVDMNDSAAVSTAYADALQLTQGGQQVQPLANVDGPLTAEQVEAYQELGYTWRSSIPPTAGRGPRARDHRHGHREHRQRGRGARLRARRRAGHPRHRRPAPERVAEIQQQVAQIPKDITGCQSHTVRSMPAPSG